MYIVTPYPNILYALDLTKPGGTPKWKYEPKQDPNVIPVMCCDTVNRGVAYADGKIFLHQADTKLVALDAKTGRPLENWGRKVPLPGWPDSGVVDMIPDLVSNAIAHSEATQLTIVFHLERDRLERHGPKLLLDDCKVALIFLLGRRTSRKRARCFELGD